MSKNVLKSQKISANIMQYIYFRIPEDVFKNFQEHFETFSSHFENFGDISRIYESFRDISKHFETFREFPRHFENNFRHFQTFIAFQIHSCDPKKSFTLRSKNISCCGTNCSDKINHRNVKRSRSDWSCVMYICRA